ncbi:L-ascorbate peroxidase 5, peroxisomal [Gracilariopsis chorda]|uniref:L-ascorbate peroxidase 5, peroxisomal n=1 Tax=Gracilariopsis chorda TaxID=448386 RepID=A0A2V3ISI5_9FLOR|nr:L-ascorbate peroxidase 5, peroxisomal [Gracilariopsis chorda]|eukprot:PXF45086.1 L-ascorbate peroxidase 5, peroxisomal [Gracilariopsis chorda]
MIRIIIEEGVKGDPNPISSFSRAAIHDCITATTSKPHSGCNASLRLDEEINNMESDGLESPVNFLRLHFPVMANQLYALFADGPQLGAEVAMNVSSGPNVIGKLVSSAKPRVVDDGRDTVDGELPSTLERWQFSSVGIHALGAFEDDNDNQKKPFTTNETSYSIDYPVNLVQRIDTKKNM